MRTDASASRRRFLGISAAAAGLALLPARGWAETEAEMVSWQGTALGANTSIRIHHHDKAAAVETLRLALRDVRRLETIFSLYREDSALVQLNRRGSLVAPPAELVDLLQESRRHAVLTGGAFDPTIQPLWQLYNGHFSMEGASPEGPDPARIAATLQLVGLDHVLVDRDRIAFKHKGMAISLNGIAQGYVTDRVVERLRSQGIEHTLVDMGESRALGHHPSGRPWQAMIADPLEPGDDGLVLPLVDMSLATSSGSGFQFDAAGRFNHIFDPRSGKSSRRYHSVSVVTQKAATADALSTAFTLMAPEAISTVLRRLGGGKVYLVGGGDDAGTTVIGL